MAGTQEPSLVDKLKGDMAASVAKDTAGMAAQHARKALSTVYHYVQRGPEGITWLCFVGGLGSIVFGIGVAVLDIIGSVTHPIRYAINAFLLVFGVVTVILESPRYMLDESQKLQKAQEAIHEYAKFLTTFGGRGLFYFFQGSLAWVSTGSHLNWLMACYMLFIGVCNVCMQYGICNGVTKQPLSVTPIDTGYVHLTQ